MPQKSRDALHGVLQVFHGDDGAAVARAQDGGLVHDVFQVCTREKRRALGQDGELKVETHFEALSPGKHAFLLCTDGFWEFVVESEMEKDLRNAADPEEWLGLMRARLTARVPSNNDNNSAAATWVDME